MWVAMYLDNSMVRATSLTLLATFVLGGGASETAGCTLSTSDAGLELISSCAIREPSNVLARVGALESTVTKELQGLQQVVAELLAAGQGQIAAMTTHARQDKYPLRPGWASFPSVFSSSDLDQWIQFDHRTEGYVGHRTECLAFNGEFYLMGTDRNEIDADADVAIRSFLAFSQPALAGVTLDLVRFGSIQDVGTTPSTANADARGAAVRVDWVGPNSTFLRMRCESESFGGSWYTANEWSVHTKLGTHTSPAASSD